MSDIFRQIADDIVLRINEQAAKDLNDGHRGHLGGSVIGDACSRKLFYGFRWFLKPFALEKPNDAGQKMRLFNRGHREEPSLQHYLETIGFTFEHTKDSQTRISDCGGHFGGSLDNTGYMPAVYSIQERIFFEFKTIADKYHKELARDGVKKAQPKHWLQICTYGYKTDLRYCLYVSVNKNTDELYVELIEVDRDMGEIMLHKAQTIINSRTPPPKFAMTPTNFACKWCNFINICHYTDPAEKNCRSCENARPIPDAKWYCDLHKSEIPETYLPVGCDAWKQIQ